MKQIDCSFWNTTLLQSLKKLNFSLVSIFDRNPCFLGSIFDLGTGQLPEQPAQNRQGYELQVLWHLFYTCTTCGRTSTNIRSEAGRQSWDISAPQFFTPLPSRVNFQSATSIFTQNLIVHEFNTYSAHDRCVFSKILRIRPVVNGHNPNIRVAPLATHTHDSLESRSQRTEIAP